MNKYPLAVGLLVLIDRVITTPFWHLESNPILLEIGVIGMWVVGIIFVGLFIEVYNLLAETGYEIIGKVCSITLIGLYSFVIITNILTIYLTV